MNPNAKAPAGRPGQCLKQRQIKAASVIGYYHTTHPLKSPLMATQTATGGAT